MKPRPALTHALCLAILLAAPARSTQAAIVVQTGAVNIVSPPPSVQLNDFQANSFIRVFQERQNHSLASALTVNATAPGKYDQLNNPVAPFPTLAAGTVVDSYFLHFDPLPLPSSPAILTFSGTLTFDRDILAVIVHRAELDSSDPLLGAGTTLYPTGHPNRGLDLAVDLVDFIEITADRRTVSFRTRADRTAAAQAFDQVRVITESIRSRQGVTLTLSGDPNQPTITVQNDACTADLTHFTITIGLLNRNYDCVEPSPVPPAFIVGAGVATLTTNRPDMNCGGGARSNDVDYSFTGFQPGEAFRFDVDVDHDTVPFGQPGTTENYRTVLFNNGSANPNAQVTLDFSDGTTESVSLPDFPVDSPAGAFQLFIPTNQCPVARCKNPTVSADENCEAATSVDDGSSDPDGGPPTLMQAPPGPYGLGPTSVELKVDDGDASAVCLAVVTVLDETPPSVTFPSDPVAECTSPAGAAVPFSVGADDNCSTDPAVVCTPPGPHFDMGTTTVDCAATDESGNATPVSFGVTVNDTTQPTVTVPAPISAECTSLGGTPVTFAVSASDTCSTPTPQCSPSSGAAFPLGTTNVKCTAKDPSGNLGSAGFDVTVRDRTRPSLQVPDPILAECTSPAGAAVPFTVTANDACSTPTPQCSPGSGDGFGFGTTNVNCSATDPSGNVGVAGFGVTVQDTVPPLITAPTSVTAECTSPAGAPVTFDVAASDRCSTPAILCSPGSGSTFGVGQTTVTCSATDGAGHVSVAPAFVVDVTSTAPMLTADLAGNPLVAQIGTAVGFSVEFSDPGDALTATWDFGDMSGIVPVPSAASPLEVDHTYTTAGLYQVVVTITDRCGNAISDDIFVVVFDPADGFTTGGGWFVPESGSHIDGAATDGTSKANFGFIVKYKKGKSTPDGNLEFQYKVGNINLKSTTMDWMVISATKVRFKGVATINGSGTYTFKVTAEDKAEPGTNIDTFKIEIWMGVVDTENGPPNPKHMTHGTLGGGNIQIHQ